MDWTIILQALWLILPAYIANGSAVLVGGGRPVDFGKNWRDGKRILGDGKTWRGLFAGAFVGMTCGFGLAVVAKYANANGFDSLGLSDFTGFPLMIPIIFSLCFGALLGDVVESFFKRRIGRERGQDWIPFDQLDFVVGALFLCLFVSLILQIFTSENWFFKSFSIWHILVIVVLTPFFHIFANFINRRIKSRSNKA
jgi:CDP-2,3-bis-(O-geranylgeranyl)-sn-glycerol synthase